MEGYFLSDNLLTNHIAGLYQDGKLLATISKIVAVAKWKAKNYGVRIPVEIEGKILGGI